MTRIPIEQLIAVIEKLLKAWPRPAAEIAREVGYSESAVRKRLEHLAYEGRAHRVRVKSDNGPGLCYTWHPGAALGAIVAQPLTPEQAAVPYQPTVRTYPANHCRDPLVGALFGPATSVEAANK